MIEKVLCFEWPSKEDGPQEESCFIGNIRTAGLYFHYLLSLYNQPLSINSLVQFIILIILFFSLLFIPIQSDHLCMSGLFFSKIDVCSLQITIVSPGWLVIGWVGEWEQAIFSPYTSGPGPTVQITMVANKNQIIEGCLSTFSLGLRFNIGDAVKASWPPNGKRYMGVAFSTATKGRRSSVSDLMMMG